MRDAHDCPALLNNPKADFVQFDFTKGVIWDSPIVEPATIHCRSGRSILINLPLGYNWSRQLIN